MEYDGFHAVFSPSALLRWCFRLPPCRSDVGAISNRLDCPCAEVICPTGSRPDLRSSGQSKNISLFQKYKSAYGGAVPHSSGGAYASSRTLGAGCDGRSSAADECCCFGRRNRVVLTPRRWRQVLLRRFSGATVAIKPGTPGRSRISRNTIVQGMPDCSANPRFLTRVLSTLHTRPRVRKTPGIPCALLLEGHRSSNKARAFMPRER
jgi:hypothetical protein